ncbi:MAG: hypothetical protein MJ177_06735 [Clostridia bacterium]|nr:hypothetical protein [Clostridia bacterium]
MMPSARAGTKAMRMLHPSPSVSSIEGAFRKMAAEGKLKREGSGKATCYYRIK